MFVNQHIVVFLWLWLLNLFIISVLMADTNDQQDCVQLTVDGHCCIFPFVYKDRIYNSCTNEHSGLLGFGKYYWCIYTGENYDRCKEPIYRPSVESTRNRTKTELSTVLKASSNTTNFANTETSSILLTNSVVTQSLNVHETRIDETSVRSSLIISTSLKKSENTATKIFHKKRKNVDVLAGGIVGGGVVLIMIIIAVYLVIRKRRVRSHSVKNKKDKNLKVEDETINPLYEDAGDGSPQNGTRAHLYEEVDPKVNDKSKVITQANPIYSST